MTAPEPAAATPCTSRAELWRPCDARVVAEVHCQSHPAAWRGWVADAVAREGARPACDARIAAGSLTPHPLAYAPPAP